MGKPTTTTVADNIRENFESLTPTERRFANAMLENYPVSCLGSITAVAESAEVSTPTVLRMVKKIGFKGFPDFQSAVRSELEEKISSPISKYNRWSESASDEHVLNKFADATMENLKQSLMQIDPVMFDEVVTKLADEEIGLHIVGGRITRSLADYLFTHMQVARRRVTRVASNSNTWPHYILNMQKGDILIAFDVRRYEHNIINLIKMARERGVSIVLFTDEWSSPGSKNAKYVFNLRTSVPSPWDSSAVILFVIEALIAAVQAETWSKTKARMAELEDLFDETKLFKKFNS